MKDLCGTKVLKDDMGYYALYMSDLAQQDLDKEIRARWENLKNSSKMTLFDRLHDAGRLITFMDYRINNLLQEIDALKAGGGPEAVVQLKEVRVRARKADDDPLKSMKDLESARAELSKQTIDDYKGSASFKEGLKRMGRVVYEYGYWVALARFRSSHPESEVEEDPFTIKPEDASVEILAQLLAGCSLVMRLDSEHREDHLRREYCLDPEGQAIGRFPFACSRGRASSGLARQRRQPCGHRVQRKAAQAVASHATGGSPRMPVTTFPPSAMHRTRCWPHRRWQQKGKN
ncbi:hypothetical protein BHM03_00045304 [Ensete ventricosum]|nr:hypothetical protein BHM03_00045304 [Ensete ventricosum]